VSKDYATGIAGAVAGSVMVMWDDLPALFDSSDANSNAAALQTRADEIGANIANRIDVSEERLNRSYSGLIVETQAFPGSEISEITWRDFGDAEGLVTDLLRSPPPEDDGISAGHSLVMDHLAPPDFARNSYPEWPRVAQIVQADDGASATGASLTANADKLYPGYVHRYAEGSYGNLDACWIRPADLETGGSPSEANVVSIRQKDRFEGRLCGIQTSGGSTRPVYLVRNGGTGTSTTTKWAVATANWTDNGSSCDHVTANPCTDCEGAGAAGPAITILFPKEPNQDPNVETGNVIAYAETSDSKFVALGGQDDKIGTVKLWALASGSIPQGWQPMDGTSNATVGSGINMNSGAADGGGQFVRGSSTAGTTGGSYEHTHAIIVAVEPHVVGDFQHTHTAATTISDHGISDLAHVHPIEDDTSQDTLNQGSGKLDTEPCTGYPVGIAPGLDKADRTNAGCDGTWGPLTHTAQTTIYEDGPDGGTLYHTAHSQIWPSPHLPPYTTLIWIERVDNST